MKQATRFPKAYFPYSKPLLGQVSVPDAALYPSPPTLSPSGSLVFSHPTASDADNTWSPETLLAMQLSYARSLAEDLANGEAVTSAIMTIPGSFTQHQRKAMRDAMDIAGLSCLSMISEGAAVGINYAMTRSFTEEKEYHLVYDSGSFSTSATLLAFYQTSAPPHNAPKSKTLINTTHIDVVAFADTPVGGVAFDQAIRQLLLDDFKKQKGAAVADVEKDARALRKLWKEASRVKHVLSANQESGSSVRI
jgi:hypoxia up-regulated 1